MFETTTNPTIHAHDPFPKEIMIYLGIVWGIGLLHQLFWGHDAWHTPDFPAIFFISALPSLIMVIRCVSLAGGASWIVAPLLMLAAPFLSVAVCLVLFSLTGMLVRTGGGPTMSFAVTFVLPALSAAIIGAMNGAIFRRLARGRALKNAIGHISIWMLSGALLGLICCSGGLVAENGKDFYHTMLGFAPILALGAMMPIYARNGRA